MYFSPFQFELILLAVINPSGLSTKHNDINSGSINYSQLDRTDTILRVVGCSFLLSENVYMYLRQLRSVSDTRQLKVLHRGIKYIKKGIKTNTNKQKIKTGKVG